VHEVTYLLAYLFTYFITPWNKVLLEKIIDSEFVNRFLAFYETQNFIIAVTSTRHLSLTYSRSIQPMPPISLPEDPS